MEAGDGVSLTKNIKPSHLQPSESILMNASCLSNLADLSISSVGEDNFLIHNLNHNNLEKTLNPETTENLKFSFPEAKKFKNLHSILNQINDILNHKQTLQQKENQKYKNSYTLSSHPNTLAESLDTTNFLNENIDQNIHSTIHHNTETHHKHQVQQQNLYSMAENHSLFEKFYVFADSVTVNFSLFYAFAEISKNTKYQTNYKTNLNSNISSQNHKQTILSRNILPPENNTCRSDPASTSKNYNFTYAYWAESRLIVKNET